MTNYEISPSGCWLWAGLIDRDGYGRFPGNDHGLTIMAHRRIWEREVGPIPAGLELDHLCRIRACVNPAHLEPVTQAENKRRAAAYRMPVGMCLRGHPYDYANTYIAPSGARKCRKCQALAVARYAARRTADSHPGLLDLSAGAR